MLIVGQDEFASDVAQKLLKALGQWS